jgi:hypothetical protein
MTYGRVRFAQNPYGLDGAAVSHLAELVRGHFLVRAKAPSSALRAPSPQGEKGPLRLPLESYIDG